MTGKISIFSLVFFLTIAWIGLLSAKVQQVPAEVIWSKQGLKWKDFQHVDNIPGSSGAIGRTTTKLSYPVT